MSWHPINFAGGHADQFSLRVPQGRQPPPVHAAGVYANGPARPRRASHRGVPVDDHRARRYRPSQLGRGTVVGHDQVPPSNTRWLASPSRKPATRARNPAGSPSSCSRDSAKPWDSASSTVPGAGKGRDVAPGARRLGPQGLEQREIMVALHAGGISRRHHAHGQAQHVWRCRASVDQVPHENGPPPARVAMARRQRRRHSPGRPAAPPVPRSTRGHPR